MSSDELRSALWAFVRRENDAYNVLVEWLPRTPELADFLGAELHAAMRATRWDDDSALFALRQRLWRHLDPGGKLGCLCAGWPDRKRLGLGSATVDLLHSDFEVLRARNPWLELVRCTTCGRHWYAATDTVDDDYYLRRLTPAELAGIVERDEWPADYDGFVNVWPTEPGQEYRARLEWPWKDQDD